jgi:hypothetical protein
MDPVICVLQTEKDRLEAYIRLYTKDKIYIDVEKYQKRLEFISKVINYAKSIEKDYI